MKTYKNCQSCSKPMKRDPMGGGTNADGSRSAMYCSTCYADGKFTHPEIATVEQMQTFVRGKLKEMGFPGFIARIFVKKIPGLERWKNG